MASLFALTKNWDRMHIGQLNLYDGIIMSCVETRVWSTEEYYHGNYGNHHSQNIFREQDESNCVDHIR